MRMYDIIRKKRDGGELSAGELAFFVRGVTDGSIPEYQISALLMAVFLRGMTKAETAALTLEMARSGGMADLSSISGVKVDKHSTGGVGDKTTLICAPIAAACGVKIAKMSGRGLGHTGGTVDKLESIPGFSTNVPRERLLQIVENTGMALIGQSENLCPADKKLYALRDVTATVESLPLIASSVMSKKIAAGADAILLDVKTGAGAFMKTLEDARALAREMVDIGNLAGRETSALITDMSAPLGRCVGNALEVREAAEVLQNRGEPRLTALCIELAAHMIYLGKRAKTIDEGRQKAKAAVKEGRALDKLCETVEAQGGNNACLREPERLALAPLEKEVKSPRAGYLSRLDAELCGLAAMELGAGREKKEDGIDYGAGVRLLKCRGQYVEKGEPIARLYTSEEKRLAPAEEKLLAAIGFCAQKPEEPPLVYEVI